MCSVQCAVCSVQCAVCSVQCAVCRRQLRNRGVASALNTMKKMPNFKKSYLEFVFKETQEEAKTAAKSLAQQEQKPSLLNREALKNFSFVTYFNNLHEVAPLITTTLVAASSKIKYREIKVGSVQCEHCEQREGVSSVRMCYSVSSGKV